MKFLFLILLVEGLFLNVLPERAQAQVFNLPTLSSSQTDPIYRTLGADLVFKPVQPPSDLGMWGLSVGVEATMASVSQMSSIPGTGSSSLVSADLSGTLQLPFGIAAEVGFLPGISLNNTTLNQFGAAVKWTMTRDFLDFLPFDMALRGEYTTASASYSQTINGSPGNVSYSSNMTGAMLSVGKSLPLLNPYIGYGFLSANSTLSSNSSALFGSGFAGGTTSSSGSDSSGWFQLGLQLKLGFFTIAAEYDNIFSVDTYNGRVAFTF